MDLRLVLALTLGALVVLRIGASLGVRLERRRKALARIPGHMARLFPGTMPARAPEDILAGIVRVWLGGQFYSLPVLSRAASREWLASLDERYTALAAAIEAAGSDTPTILAALIADAEGLYDLLRAYDAAGSGLLPPLTELEDATDTEILRAVLEVWRAVNPKAAISGTPLPNLTLGESPTPPTTQPVVTAGTPASSMP